MKHILLIFITITLTVSHSLAHAGLVVVVNQNNPIESLSSRQVIDFYMGRYTSYPDGRTVDTTDLPDNSSVRDNFYKQLVDKSTKQVNAYWARLLFAGKAEPPLTKSTMNEVVDYVIGNSNAIAYINENSVTPGLKVVFRFENNK